MESKCVSRKLLKRLPVYLNYLKSLPDNSVNISATAIAKALELGDVQVRKDLAKISAGRCRTGRSKGQLILDIENFLDVTSETGAIVVGAGKLGQALMDYSGFEEAGLNVMAGFDLDPLKKNSKCGKPIYPMHRMEFFCRCYDVRIGIITVPGDSAQRTCDAMVACGIEAIWNFAPVHLNVPENVIVQSENLAVSLASLRNQTKN